MIYRRPVAIFQAHIAQKEDRGLACLKLNLN